VFASRSSSRFRSSGFTLVEGLIVIVIMMLMISGLQLSTKPTTEQKQRGAHALAGSLLREARLTALSRLNRVRLLVHDDDSQPQLKRRGVAILVETAPDSNKWEIVGTPEVLPQGVLWVLLNDGGQLKASAPMRIGAWHQGVTCASYEFLPTGRISGLRYTFGIGGGSIMADDGYVRLTNPKDVRGWTVTTYGVGAELENLGKMMNSER
jgi:type II secretory pathway pseudopilin PulG